MASILYIALSSVFVVIRIFRIILFNRCFSFWRVHPLSSLPGICVCLLVLEVGWWCQGQGVWKSRNPESGTGAGNGTATGTGT